jgi:surface antigen
MKPLAKILRMSKAYRLVSSLREARAVLLRLACLALAGPMLGGCSFSIASLKAEAPEEVTGSITPAPTVQILFPDLGPEEVRRSRAALAVALDPQGNGHPVKWDNPESGMRGEIAAGGPPFVESDEICRAFSASLQTKPGGTKRAEGRACKISADEWVLRKLQRRT